MVESDAEPKTLKERRKETPTEEEITISIATAHHIPDYEAALVCASLVEFMMRQAIISRIVPIGSTWDGRLFDSAGSGPLSTFSAKQKLCYALGLMTGETFAQVDLIRTVRNHFAHFHQPVKFNEPSVAAECSKLKLPLILRSAKADYHPRVMYTTVCLYVALSLERQIRNGTQITPTAKEIF